MIKPKNSVVDVDQVLVMINAGMEVHNTNIRIWIHDQDLAKLEKVVWEGMGHLLIKHTSAHTKIRKFLEAVPRLMNDIKNLHSAAVHGDVDKVADKEFRQQVYLSKDINGISAFHKAVVNGHREMADHIMEKTDRACFNVVDRNGRTALHYGAALSEFDDIGMYGWLMNMGYDKTHTDNYMRTADYYVSNSGEIDLAKCTYIPEAPRVNKSDQGGHSEAVAQSQERPNKLVASPKKTAAGGKRGGKKATKKDTSGSTTRAGVTSAAAVTAKMVKSEKALFTMNPKTVTNEAIAKWIKAGDLEKLEMATLMGKGKQLVGKATWNDAARSYIKNVANVMDQLDVLFKSATKGDVDKVKDLLAKNKKYVFARDSQGRTALHLAAMHGNLDVVKFILSENAEYTQITDSMSRTVLHYSARCPNESLRGDIFDECIMNGADKFAKDAFGNDCEYYYTHDFPKTGSNASEKTNGAQEEDEVFEDDSPTLDTAIQAKDFDKLVKYVLEGNSDKLIDRSSDDEEVQEFIKNIPAFQEKIGQIHDAVEEGSLKSLKSLLNRKKYALAKEKVTGASILHKAIIYGHTDIVKFLSGAFPDTLSIRDRMGRTACHYAAICNDGGQYYELLRQYGADTKLQDSLGNSPEHYAENKTDMDFQELIDFVEKRKPMPATADSGRSSSMSTSRGSTSNLAADIALTRWILSQDSYVSSSTNEISAEIKKKLDNGFRRLTWARRQTKQSLLKRFLTKSIFNTLKLRQTSSGVNLYDVAKVGFEHLDSKIGVLAFDPECYAVFRPLFHPIICTIHQATPMVKHPEKSDWDRVDRLPDVSTLDPDGKYISKVAIRVARSLKNYPFVPQMTRKQLESLELEIRSGLKSMHSLTGVYYSMATIPKDVFHLLSRGDLIFTNGDKFLESGGVYHHWPLGRGVYVTHMKDTYIWVNESEHAQIGVVQKGSDLKAAFDKMANLLDNLEDHFKWAKDRDRLGWLTMSPALIGSGLKIFVHVKLPYLGIEETFREELLEQFGMECVKAQHASLADNAMFVVSNKRTFGMSECEILSSVYRCIKEIIAIEDKCSSLNKNEDLKMSQNVVQ